MHADLHRHFFNAYNGYLYLKAELEEVNGAVQLVNLNNGDYKKDTPGNAIASSLMPSDFARASVLG